MSDNKTLQRGFTLIEVMVALVILAVGLLGMASLMVRSQQNTESAYLRSQATILAYDILERMRTNKVIVSGTSFSVSHASLSDDYAITALPTCTTPTSGVAAAGSARATQDLASWCQQVQTALPAVNRSETKIVNKVESGIKRTIVTIAWNENTSDGASTQRVSVGAKL